MVFSFTNTDFYDSIKKKSGIIKLKGEVYERKIIYNARIYNGKGNQENPEGTASDTKKEFAELINCSKPTSRALGEK